MKGSVRKNLVGRINISQREDYNNNNSTKTWGKSNELVSAAKMERFW